MFLILLLVLIVILMYIYNYLYKDEEFDKIPGPKGKFLIENSLDFWKDFDSLFLHFRSLAQAYKDLYKFKIFNIKCVSIYNPEDVETILTSPSYNDKSYIYFLIRPWLNDGLLVSNGTKWRHRRKILTPAFHFKILRHFSSMLIENSERLVENLRSETKNSKTMIHPFISNMTLNSICETAMGVFLDKAATDIQTKYKNGVHTLSTYMVYRFQRFWLFPNIFFNLSIVGQKQQKLLKEMRSFRDHVINQRRKSHNYKNVYQEVMNEEEDEYLLGGKKRLAMLDLLLQIEEQGNIDVEGINEEVDTFMFEGHDTTASTLQFAFLELANNPKIQDKIFEECQRIFGTSGRKPTTNDLPEMRYIECFIKETLRLYPIAPIILRSCKKELQLKNYKCPAGTECAIQIFDLHRREDQFPEPLQFRPERFQEAHTWHPFAYIPFSAGPRNCIGQKFAMMEMKIAIAAVVRDYRLLPVTKPKDVTFTADIILRPVNPIYVKFEKRS